MCQSEGEHHLTLQKYNLAIWALAEKKNKDTVLSEVYPIILAVKSKLYCLSYI